ncbi:hypothetical protein [Nocardioides acrostichi]|uniref:Uncharacterized protein n=1 Tax=Nocardioides acrostichi TaxID=2784339 RepID=A0A930Y987_9ACTN|nr:hypothetical protein [Nocardioides acrostichi]MBF4163912.1 hypothetical protein [Nocardioides acrostichi]
MPPLQLVALGLAVITLVAPAHGYDLLPDPVGWVLVLVGLRRLPASDAVRRTLLTTALIALVVAGIVWIPSVHARVDGADPSISWALSLPQLAVLALLGRHLRAVSGEAGDRRASAWWATLTSLVVAAALLPVVVLGAGVGRLTTVTAAVAALSLLGTILLCFAHGQRPWAMPPAPVEIDGSATKGRADS